MQKNNGGTDMILYNSGFIIPVLKKVFAFGLLSFYLFYSNGTAITT